ncbi:MAG: molybdate ABC transporter substrate-binding protein [Candidatus Nanopelagicales bacterium]
MRAVWALTLVSLAACGGAGNSSEQLTVAGAASLTKSFTAMAEAFEQANPGVDVVITFGPSSSVAAQVRNGAPVDVVATANEETMNQVVRADIVTAPIIFARNVLTVVVPSANRAGISSFEDLAAPNISVAVCQPQVPCGAAAAQTIAQSGLSISPVTRENDVRGVLTKVIADEVDAGFVYITDAVGAAEEVREIAIPAPWVTAVKYPIARVTSSSRQQLAEEFIEFVTSAAGQSILSAAGFMAPEGAP